eukprot:m.942 g.942  ORF g.942 m.942 type:complete len:203 (+) comp5255_c0_seq1:131-739(+)
MSGRCTGCQLCFAVCRIALTVCCRKLCGCKRPQPRPEYSILCIGLSGVGKSTLLATLSNEKTENIEPTTGFSIKAVGISGAVLNIQELGGSEAVRPYWSHYYGDKQGIIFVVDLSSSVSSIEVAAQEFSNALDHLDLASLPVLVVFNKQDLQPQIEKVAQHFLSNKGTHLMTCSCSYNDVTELKEKLEELSEIIKTRAFTTE